MLGGMQITPLEAPAYLPSKRCYLPFVITAQCPTCGEQVERSLTSNSLHEPPINTPFALYMWHEHEDDVYHEWEVSVILRVHMEAASIPQDTLAAHASEALDHAALPEEPTAR